MQPLPFVEVFVRIVIMLCTLALGGCMSSLGVQASPLNYDSKSMRILGPVRAEQTVVYFFGLPGGSGDKNMISELSRQAISESYPDANLDRSVLLNPCVQIDTRAFYIPIFYSRVFRVSGIAARLN